MIVGYHIIFSTYGFWLPNDPRGSWSDFVGSWELFRFGRATKTTETRSRAYDEHDTRLRLAAKRAMKYPPVNFTGSQARSVGRAFGKYIAKRNIEMWACAILPDHVHLVTGRLPMKVEQLVIQLKGDSTQELEQQGIHPLARFTVDGKRVPKCWAQGHWKVYLDPDDVQRAIQYVANNPLKEGYAKQTWPFVTKFK